MKRFRFLIYLCPLVLLTACGLSDQQKADYDSVQRAGVNSGVYDKMVHDDPLSPNDIISLSRKGVSDGVIIRYIRDHGTIYSLTSSEVTNLRKSGVSESVVDYMLRTQVDQGPDVIIGVGPYPYWGPGPFWGPYWGPGPYYHGGYGGYHHWH